MFQRLLEQPEIRPRQRQEKPCIAQAAAKTSVNTQISVSSAESALPPLAAPPKRPFARYSADKKIAGVCAGVARYLDLDANLVRAIWLLCLLRWHRLSPTSSSGSSCPWTRNPPCFPHKDPHNQERTMLSDDVARLSSTLLTFPCQSRKSKYRGILRAAPPSTLPALNAMRIPCARAASCCRRSALRLFSPPPVAPAKSRLRGRFHPRPHFLPARKPPRQPPESTESSHGSRHSRRSPLPRALDRGPDTPAGTVPITTTRKVPTAKSTTRTS